MRWTAGLIGWLWRFARDGWIDVRGGLRLRNGAAKLYVFLFMFFVIVACILLLLGIDLDAADRWIDAQASWLDTVGSIALRIVFALILLGCATAVATGLYQRLPGRRAHPTDQPGNARVGWGAMILALIVGYFAVIGTFGRY